MLKERIKNAIIKNEQADGKKKIENLVVFIIILIVTIVAINFIWKDEKSKTSKAQVNNTSPSSYKQLADTSSDEEETNKEELEEKLENILSKIEGVGDVKTLITYSQSSEIVAMYNEKSKTSSTNENDSEGGIRNIEETDTTKEVIYQEENGVNIPVTTKVIKPKIEGVLVTAVGANNATTKTNIIQAVEAVTGVATHKIQVFEMSKN